MVRWWLDKGVDGFRLDAINIISKPEGYPDDPPPTLRSTLPQFRSSLRTAPWYTRG